MGFLRQYGIILTIVLTLALVGGIWHVRGKYDNSTVISDTAKVVEPIEQKESLIIPLAPDVLLNRLQHHKF